jgi:hypothetical protein
LRQKKTLGHWNPVESKALLLQVVSEIATKKSVYIFVDGLDEYQGDDLGNVIKLVKDLKNPNAKLCMSSLPEQRIINQLQIAAILLKMEEFTKRDTERFISDELVKVDLDNSTPAPLRDWPNI